MSYTYVIIDTENRGDHLVRGKIGKSYNPRKRMTELQTGSSGRLRLLCALEGEEWEPLLQRAHRDWCVGGEWFAMDASYFLVIASLAEAQRGEYGVDEGAVSDLADLVKGWTEPSLAWVEAARVAAFEVDELRAYEEAERLARVAA